MKSMRQKNGFLFIKEARTLKTKQQCNPEKFQEKISERLERDKPKTVKKERLKLAKLILTGIERTIAKLEYRLVNKFTH